MLHVLLCAHVGFIVIVDVVC